MSSALISVALVASTLATRASPSRPACLRRSGSESIAVAADASSSAVARVDAATRPRGTRADARASAARRAAAGASPHDESATGEERRDATGTTRAAAANAPHDDARIETMRMPAARTDDTRGGWTGARRRASPKCGAPQKAPPTIASSHQDDRPTATTRVRVTRGCSARVGLDCHAICTIQK